jgi:hypothetical protein
LFNPFLPSISSAILLRNSTLGLTSARVFPGCDAKEAAVIRRIVAACFLLTFLVLANIALAQEFSADVVSQKSDNVGMKKVYAAKDKVRFEVQGGEPTDGTKRNPL